MKYLISTVFLLTISFFLDGCHKKIADNTPTTIQWLSIEEAATANAQKPRKILVDVYTDWCGWCKRMDAQTFQHPEIAKFVNKNYYAVKLNGEGKQTIQYNGKTYNNTSGKAHDLAITLLEGRMGYPSIVFLDEKMQKIQTYPGFQTADKFDLLLNYYSQDRHKKGEDLATFASTFKSKIAVEAPK